jgi:exodeoxyribonuclease VII large subunit
MELILPERREVLARMNALGARMGSGLTRRTRVIEERLFRAEDRLESAISGRIRDDQEQLGVLGAQLEALSPLRVLARGYAVATGVAGQVLRRKADFAPGAGFTLRVADGEVPARVEES